MAEYDSLPNINGINWEQAHVNLPDMDLLFSIVNDFCVNAAGELGELSNYYDTYFATGEDEAMENYRIKVHALKNSLALIGAQSLSDAAKALEYASRDREVETVRRDNTFFVTEYEKLAAEVARVFEIDRTPQTKEFDSAVFKSELDTLKAAFDEFDIETLNDTMERIESFNVSDPLASIISGLSGAVLTLDEDDFYNSIEALYELI